MKRFILIKTWYDKLKIIDTEDDMTYDDYVYEDKTKKSLCGETEIPYGIEDNGYLGGAFYSDYLGEIIKESNSKEVLEKLIRKLDKEK